MINCYNIYVGTTAESSFLFHLIELRGQWWKFGFLLGGGVSGSQFFNKKTDTINVIGVWKTISIFEEQTFMKK